MGFFAYVFVSIYERMKTETAEAFSASSAVSEYLFSGSTESQPPGNRP